MSEDAPAARAVRAALAGFVARYLEVHAGGDMPRTLHDARWPSPCECGLPDAAGRIEWRPRARAEGPDYRGWERALEQSLHPAVRAFFGSYYSEHLAARTAAGSLTLIQVWNDADFDRLVENQLGHALAKRRARLPLTVFVACTDEDDLILSVDNASGAVVLERPGHPPQRQIAADLASFIDELAPSPGPASTRLPAAAGD